MAKAEIILVGTDDGVVLLSNPGGIGRWLKSAHALRNHAIIATWAHPDDPTRMLCSTTTQCWQSVDGGQTWNPTNGPAFLQLHASRTTAERIWAHDGHTAYISHDAGDTWQAVANAQHIATSSEVLWYSDNTHSHQSVDGGATWQLSAAWDGLLMSHDGQYEWRIASTGLSLNNAPISDAPSGFVPLVAYGGTPCVIGSAQHDIWRYDGTWQMVDAFATHHLTAMASTIYHPDRAWAGDKDGTIWYSSNRGITWDIVRGGFAAIRSFASARLV